MQLALKAPCDPRPPRHSGQKQADSGEPKVAVYLAPSAAGPLQVAAQAIAGTADEKLMNRIGGHP